ncbi:MAG: hypothetical protein R3C53_10980 [Pirellulaceae bacterium]
MSVARRNIMTLGIVTLSVVAMGAHQASAADPKLEQTALSLAPEDSAFFATSLNMRQSYEEFMESRFVQRLKAVPFVRRLESELVDQWDNPSEELKQAKFFLDSPAAQNLVKLVIDMSSTEFFFYGENDWCEAIEGIMRVQNDLSGLANQGEEAIRQYILDLQPNDVAVMRVPTTVVGFKLSSDEIAREQLDTLEGIIRLGLSSNEELSPIARQLKRADFKDGQSLSLTLNTDMIPRIDLDGDQAEMMDKILELLEGRSLSIAVGVKANMLLFTISEKADALKQVGANETQLLNHDAIAVLVEQAPEDLRSISFNSERWRQSSWDANLGRYFERLAAQFSAAMESEPENIPDMEQWQSEIMVDAKWLDAKIAEAKPDFGATLSWSHAIDGGMEGFT